jgi:D-methionine transport system ATP-binding protein
MVTHEMDVIETVCDYVAVMEKGDVIETGSTLQIFSQPQHPTTKNFIQTVLQQNLPVNILTNLENQNHHSIYCLKFLGSSAQETVIQGVIKQFDISLNILFANMTEINGSVIGQMFIQLLGDPAQITAAIQYLRDNGVQVDQAGVQE